MKCQDCGGELDTSKVIKLPTAWAFGIVFPCCSCKRLHWYQNGTGVYREHNGHLREIFFRHDSVGYVGSFGEWNRVGT